MRPIEEGDWHPSPRNKTKNLPYVETAYERDHHAVDIERVASVSSEVNIQKDAGKSGRGCQRYYCMRMSCQDAGAMRMSSFHFTRRYFPEIYVERGHLPPKPRDCARRIRIRIKKWTSCKTSSTFRARTESTEHSPNSWVESFPLRHFSTIPPSNNG